ncbi:MAG: haloacid dehalogenase type II [SAR324 cluster bacterium]|nr:haloacid dehalogenase type II [SAR324 cluster bacterium]
MDFGSVKALTFDVGGTVLDWHRGIVAEVSALGERKGISADWPKFTNSWRRNALSTMLGEREGEVAHMNIDGVHRLTLEEALREFQIEGLSDADKDELAAAWHRLSPWPDAPAGIARLREKLLTATLTILSVSLIVAVSRRAPFHWDYVFSCEMIGQYKPRPVAYETGARWLGLRPEQCMMVACHNFDLLAAQKVGFRTAFIHRPQEWGPEPPPQPTPDPSIDVVADDLIDLAAKLGA